MNSIAYVDHEGILNVLGGAGDSPRRINAPDTYCTWPNWSPDGRTIAFSGYQSVDAGDNELGMYLADLDGDDARLAYANDFETGEIAPNTPHYSLWSPDGSKLAFVAQTSDGA
ncbi:MAG TPA: hypothetical protein DDY93_04330, partial [Dehalococcoidia bacterium]|nr:hypothetical protein [Dehalococcoidia bacterium]